MKLCAGIFVVKNEDIVIRLSEPLLKFRSLDEIKETLLHEMIHAFLFIERVEAGRDGHGPRFVDKMKEINSNTGLNITVYHSFHDEVDFYRTHIWKCNGKCNKKPPNFGLVKRSMNRATGKNDYWWREHEKNCGGVFEKIAGKGKEDKKVGKKVLKEKGKEIEKKVEMEKHNSKDKNKEIDKEKIKKVDKENINIVSSEEEIRNQRIKFMNKDNNINNDGKKEKLNNISNQSIPTNLSNQSNLTNRDKNIVNKVQLKSSQVDNLNNQLSIDIYLNNVKK